MCLFHYANAVEGGEESEELVNKMSWQETQVILYVLFFMGCRFNINLF